MMRDELRNLVESKYWIYGPTASDCEYTVALAKRLVESQFDVYRQREAEVRRSHPELADDILDDIAYYTYIDTQYVWHFCLWRLQAIFEALIVYRLLETDPAQRLVGLRGKLTALRRAGYRLSSDEEDELLAWGALRNALSHAPPEQYNPGPLAEADVLEYRALIEELWQRWQDERPALSST